MRPDVPVAPSAPLDGPGLSRISGVIEAICGLDAGGARRSLLESSVRLRMGALGIDEVEGYLARLCSDGTGEIGALINRVTITETQFFRDPAQFGLLRHIVRTLLLEREPLGQRRLRICSAGCASGEEPYSVALTWREMGIPASHPDWTAEIVGIDVNTDMLAAARDRLYSARAVRNVDEDCLRRYFTPAGRSFKLDEGVARGVRFEHGSVTRDGSFGSNRYDVILCKNVAIYFRPEVTRRLVRGLYGALTPGGYLLLGHSESLWQMEEGLALVEHGGVFCYRKPIAGGVSDAGEADGTRSGFCASAVERHGRSTPACGEASAPLAAESPEDRYEQCRQQVRSGDWARAQGEVEALIESHETFAPGHLLLAGIHVHLGRYSEASECASRVLRLDPLEAKAHLLLGMTAARGGRQQEAADALRRALDLDDSLALAYFWLGNLYRDQGHAGRACAEYRRAVARHDRGELDFSEEFAADLYPAQIVDFCRASLERLKGTW